MNTQEIINIAKQETPNIEVNGKEDWLRYDIVNLLTGNSNIGIELGVASGGYSKRMVESNKFSRFYGVDVYSDHHNTNEYCNTLKLIGVNNPKYCLLRMDFENAYGLFDDEFFDFVYIDGYAHTGEEGGKTIVDWYKKVKVGGILAGDDYHESWPLVVWAVNDIAKQLNVPVNLALRLDSAPFSHYPSWFIIKTDNNTSLKVNNKLFTIAMSEKQRIHELRQK